MQNTSTSPSLFNPLDYPACLQHPRHLTDVWSWHEHVPFAFALVQILQPKVFVELGTHKGDSYCAFCQAVDFLGTDTSCYAVDSWEGDQHAGEYDSTVFEDLRAFHDPLYGRFSTLLRATFDQALGRFSDGCIDLLHIDGLHTYEAVKHDFESWLPKISEKGVVLLHDTNVRQGDFGVWRLWDEIKECYPSFEFKHGYGLGVVAVGAEVPDALRALLKDSADPAAISAYFSRLGGLSALAHRRGLQLADLQAELERARERLRQQDEQLAERARHVDLLQERLAQSHAERQHILDRLAEKNSQIDLMHVRLMERVHHLELLKEQFDNVSLHLQALRRTRTVRLSQVLGIATNRMIRVLSGGAQDVVGPLLTVADRLWCVVKGPIRGALDVPTQGSTWDGKVLLAGWAISMAGSIERVEVLDETRTILGSVPYGLTRRDVIAARPGYSDVNCGYSGTVDLDSLSTGPVTLIVRVSDTKGNRQDFLRTILLTQPHQASQTPDVVESGAKAIHPKKALAEIERAEWLGNCLEVVGWALWPSSSFPRVARIYVDDESVGEARVNLSRPDIKSRFPTNPLASRCGFRFRHFVSPPQHNAGEPIKLSVRFVDGEGTVIQRDLSITPETSPNQLGDGQLRIDFENILTDYRTRFERDPAILDWNTGLNLALVFPLHTVFSPPADASFLPYIDRSVDIVVVSSGNAAVVAEARRVAESVVINLSQTELTPDFTFNPGSTTSYGCRLAVEWLSNQPARALPSTSIIIPVHNGVDYTKACLEALKSTLPLGFNGEIIVVDDASTDETPALLDRFAVSDKYVKVLKNTDNLGFIDTCNRGAATAKGDILVFLNSDAFPQPGWLPALLQIFRDHPGAGAVGGKLIFPDGRLQEAGGVIFSDGSGANFGKWDEEPDASLYSYVREVDYCSGALLATRSWLFRDIGGFDTRFRPAYYEDTDYCFSVRERGYRVYYQPECRATHVEGASHGTDLNSGLKRHQVVNCAKFVEKWNHALKRQPALPNRLDHAIWHALAVRDEVEATLGQ